MKMAFSTYHWTPYSTRQPRAILLGAQMEKKDEGYETGAAAPSCNSAEECAALVLRAGFMEKPKMDRESCNDASSMLKYVLRQSAAVLRADASEVARAGCHARHVVAYLKSNYNRCMQHWEQNLLPWSGNAR